MVKDFMERFYQQKEMTSDEMFIFDENSSCLGLSKDKLMENAGVAAARFIIERFKPLMDKEIHVFCGTGNNGGDGFVIARYLSGFSKSVDVYLIGRESNIRTPEARDNWSILKRQRYTIRLHEIFDSSWFTDFKGKINPDSILIDALLGTGIKGRVREPAASAIRLINHLKVELGIPVISVDVPSGLNPDTGETSNVVIEPSCTLTFHMMKKGMSKKPNQLGEFYVFPIGIPPEASWIVGDGDAKLLLKKKRDPRSTKGKNGKVLIIGGCEHYSGAPSLAALACLQCGIDLVEICAPTSVASTIRSYSPDLIVSPLEGKWITMEHLDFIKEKITWADTILIGPGLGRKPQTKEAVLDICRAVSSDKKNLIVDAD
ncbi:MAG: NAD(P)H-hydrate epimerase, partial [Promethearchaeota archaeon]